MVNFTDTRGNHFTVPNDVADDYRAEAAPEADPTPTPSTRNDDIATWAARHSIDLGDATTKAEMLAAIEAVREV